MNLNKTVMATKDSTKLLIQIKKKNSPNLPELIISAKFANHFIYNIDTIYDKLTKLINLPICTITTQSPLSTQIT